VVMVTQPDRLARSTPPQLGRPAKTT
jgi:hypothetical protein